MPHIHDHWLEIVVHIDYSSFLWTNSFCCWLWLCDLRLLLFRFFVPFLLLLEFFFFLFLFLFESLLFFFLSQKDFRFDVLFCLLHLKLFDPQSLFNYRLDSFEYLSFTSIGIYFVEDAEFMSRNTELVQPVLETLVTLIKCHPLVNQCGFTLFFLVHRCQSFTQGCICSQRRGILNMVHIVIHRIVSPTESSPDALLSLGVKP